MTTWVDRAEVRRANDQKIEGMNQHDFQWLHLGCEKETKVTVVNSDKVDPATSDPLPVEKTVITCHTHNVSSEATYSPVLQSK